MSDVVAEYATEAAEAIKDPRKRTEAEQLLKLAALTPSAIFFVTGLDGAVGQVAIKQMPNASSGAVSLAGYAARLGCGHFGTTKALQFAAKGNLVKRLMDEPLPTFLRDYIQRDL